MTMRGICVIFVFTVGLIGVVNVHACAEPDPVANSLRQELNRESLAATHIGRRATNDSLQVDGAESMSVRWEQANRHTEERSSAAPGRVAK